MTTQFTALMRTYKFEKTFPTNISSEYLNDSGSKWGTWEMLRESIQNMLDEAEYMADNNGGDLLDHLEVKYFAPHRVKMAGQHSYLELRDKGRGVDWERIFLIGESGKRGTHYRGQKGEGEGLSFLVAARLGVDKVMFSRDWAVKARLDSYAGSAYQVLVFDLYRTDKPVEGTIWRYYTTPEISKVYEDLPNYFPQLSKRAQRSEEAQAKRDAKDQQRYDRMRRKSIVRQVRAKNTASNKMIITPKNGKSARLFVRGIFVKEIFALFSYNLKNVEINRDRSMVNEFEILNEIQTAFNSDDLTMAQAVEYWKKAQDSVGDAGLMEYKTVINVTNSKNFMMLNKAFYKAFGKKACVFTNRVAALDADSLGFKVVDLHPYAKDTAMNLDIRPDRVVLGYEGDVKPMKHLTTKHQQLLWKLADIGQALGFADYPIVPVEKMLGVNDDNLGGFYQDGKVHIMKSVLEGNRLELLRVYIHEAGHGESGASDATRDFTKFFEDLAVAALTGKHDPVRSLIDELVQIRSDWKEWNEGK